MGARGPKSAASLTIAAHTPVRSAPAKIKPPRPLGKHGKAAWDRMVAAYDFSEPAGAEMLAQACAAIDLAEASDDPKVVLQARAFATRTIARLCE